MSGLGHEQGSAKLAQGADRLDAGKACTYTTCTCLDRFIRWLDAHVHDDSMDSPWLEAHISNTCMQS